MTVGARAELSAVGGVARASVAQAGQARAVHHGPVQRVVDGEDRAVLDHCVMETRRALAKDKGLCRLWYLADSSHYDQVQTERVKNPRAS